jgi:TonB family protein
MCTLNKNDGFEKPSLLVMFTALINAQQICETLAKIALNNINMKKLFILPFIFLSVVLVGQETKSEYVPFMKDGYEYQTNGIDTIFIVDPMPEFPGGDLGFMKFIRNNIKYPKSAKKDKIEGKVYVQFVINRQGETEQVIVVRGVREDLDKEAMRVIRKSPKWKPGEQHGKPVKVAYTIPINFEL